MCPPYYVSIILKDGDLYSAFPFIDAVSLKQAQEKALYWYTVYNGNAGDITLQNFGLGRQVFTQDQRYSFTIHQYPF